MLTDKTHRNKIEVNELLNIQITLNNAVVGYKTLDAAVKRNQVIALMRCILLQNIHCLFNVFSWQ